MLTRRQSGEGYDRAGLFLRPCGDTRRPAARRISPSPESAGVEGAVDERSPGARPTPAGVRESDSIAAMAVSAQYSVTIRVELDARQEPLGKLTAGIAEAGGQLQGVDLVPGAGPEGKRVREFTIDAADRDHWERILRAIGSTRGARVLDYVDRTMQMHRGGKIDTTTSTR